MFELFWGLLNAGLFIYFLLICIKLLKIFKEKIGILATLVLALGLLSFVSNRNERNLAEIDIDFSTKEIPKKNFEGNSYFQQVKLEDNLSSKIRLSILVGEKEKELIILKANCSREGFISGTNWIVKNVFVEKQLNRNYCNYYVSGIMEWKILGITLYSEHKNFKGNTILKRE